MRLVQIHRRQRAAKEKATVVLDLTSAEQNVLARGLDRVLAQWAADYKIGGVVSAVAVGPDIIWRGATGDRPDGGSPVTVNDRIDLASITKLFTAVLVHRFADSGLIDIEGPLPQLQSLPEFPYDQGITVAHLLEHRSGLVNYSETTPYLLDPGLVADPVAAVMASLGEGLLAAPGEVFAYSSTNYLVLGLLLEEVSGRPYDELLVEGRRGPGACLARRIDLCSSDDHAGGVERSGGSFAWCCRRGSDVPPQDPCCPAGSVRWRV